MARVRLLRWRKSGERGVVIYAVGRPVSAANAAMVCGCRPFHQPPSRAQCQGQDFAAGLCQHPFTLQRAFSQICGMPPLHHVKDAFSY